MRGQALLQGLMSGKVRPVGPMGYAGRAAGAYDSKAREVQEALMQLVGKDASQAASVRTGSMQDVASRMAASPQALMALKAVPAVGVLAGLGLKDEDETFANQAMDLLGMGAGMYGMNRGINALGGTTRAGAALGAGVGAFGGTMGVDALQGLIGI